MKNKVLKTTVSIALASVLALTAASCGKKKTTENSNSTTNNTKITTNNVTTAHQHVFDQEVISGDYFISDATCTEGKKFYKSCSCGEKGSETFTVGAPLGHDINSTGVCSRCKKNYGNTVTWDDEISNNWYLHFKTVDKKIYINFTTINALNFGMDLEGQQYFYNPITEDDLKLNPVKNIKLFKEDDETNTFKFLDIDYVDDEYYYFWWQTIDELEANTKYYLEITLDKDYDDFTLYFYGVDKTYNSDLKINIETTEHYKFYDGKPFEIKATAPVGKLEIAYFDDDNYYKAGSKTAPVEQGNYIAKLYVYTDDEFYEYNYSFSIFANETIINLDESNYLRMSNYMKEGTKISTKFYAEKDKEYIVYAEENSTWSYILKDEKKTYDFDFSVTGYILFKAENTGYVTVEGTKNSNSEAYYVSAHDITEIDVTKEYKFTFAPKASKIIKLKTEDVPIFNIKASSVIDELKNQNFYIYTIFSDLSEYNIAYVIDENYMYAFDFSYDKDYYYIKIFNDTYTERDIDFKLIPLISKEIELNKEYVDDTKNNAPEGERFLVNITLEKDKEYNITIQKDYICTIYDKDYNLIMNLYTENNTFTPSEDGLYYIDGYKNTSNEAPFIIKVYE